MTRAAFVTLASLLVACATTVGASDPSTLPSDAVDQCEAQCESVGLEFDALADLGCEIEIIAPIGVFHHAYTHFSVTLHAFSCRLKNGRPRLDRDSVQRWVRVGDLVDFPMGKLDRRISQSLLNR